MHTNSKKHWSSLLLAAQTLTHSKGKLATGCCSVAWRARRPIKMPVTNKLAMPMAAQAIEPFPEVFGFGVMMDSHPSLYPLQSHSATLASSHASSTNKDAWRTVLQICHLRPMIVAIVTSCPKQQTHRWHPPLNSTPSLQHPRRTFRWWWWWCQRWWCENQAACHQKRHISGNLPENCSPANSPASYWC